MVSSIMSHSKIKCRLDHLTQQLIDLIQVRWNNQLASDLKVTICDCLRVLGNSCPPDTVSVEKRKVLIKQIYNLLIQRVGTGFQFDEAPSAVSNRLYYFTASESKAAINARPSILGGGVKHHLLIGENYYALQNLIAAGYRQQVDIIYIDPPYNTQEQQSYKDKFKRCGWLTMMKERLTLAHQLLARDGMIFLSINDHEQAYLKVLMDSIFKESNFIANFIWKSKTKTNDAKFLSTVTEYILVYAKDSRMGNFTMARNLQVDDSTYQQRDEFFSTRGGFKLQKLDNASHTYSSTLDYEFTHQGVKYYPGGDQKQWAQRQAGRHAVKDWQWMWAQQTLLAGIKNHQVVFKDHNIFTKRYWKVDHKLVPITRSEPFTNLIADPMFLNARGNRLLVSVLGAKLFDHPKPVSLMQHLLRLHPCGKDALVLDFFAGSGTTAHAVLALNHEDGGHRRFILCTNNENQIADVCYERLHRIMTGRGTKGETNFPWLRTNRPYGGQLFVYDGQSRSVGFNPTLELRTNFEPYSQWEQALIATYRQLNPDFNVRSADEWLHTLLQLTVNSCAENKET